MVVQDGRGRDPVDPTCAERSRRIEVVQAHWVKVPRLDETSADDLQAAGHDGEEVVEPRPAFPAVFRSREAVEHATGHLGPAWHGVNLEGCHVLGYVAAAAHTPLEVA